MRWKTRLGAQSFEFPPSTSKSWFLMKMVIKTFLSTFLISWSSDKKLKTRPLFPTKGYAVLMCCNGWRLEEQPEMMALFPMVILWSNFLCTSFFVSRNDEQNWHAVILHAISLRWHTCISRSTNFTVLYIQGMSVDLTTIKKITVEPVVQFVPRWLKHPPATMACWRPSLLISATS